MECCVMCGGRISLVERDLAYVEMFSGRRSKILHAGCHTKLKTKRLIGGPIPFCAALTNLHGATEYCPFCFWMFCAEHSPRDKHECNFEATTPEDWSAEAIAADGAATVKSRGPQYNVTDKCGERSMTAVVEIMNILRRGRTGPWTTRDGWLFMVVLKLVRASMLTPLRDTFVDLAGYAGLAGEERGEELKRK